MVPWVCLKMLEIQFEAECLRRGAEGGGGKKGAVGGQQ